MIQALTRALPRFSCVTLDKLINFSVPWFLCETVAEAGEEQMLSMSVMLKHCATQK